ncbi:hypothetical protein V8C86DRAFT_2874442 [Haematococcus lacustris]
MFGMTPFFGRDPVFGNMFSDLDRVMNSMLSAPMGFPPMHQAQQEQYAPHRSTAHIEELDGHETPAGHGGSAIQPIVEEPDDDDPAKQRQRQRPRHYSPPRRSQPAPAPTAPAFGFGGLFGNQLQAFGGAGSGAGGGTHFFSSSSFVSSGPNGVTYQASHSERMGPGGVREVQSSVRDGRTGKQEITIARGLGDKERIQTRRRDASGQETAEDILRGLEADEADTFEQRWLSEAERSLLGGPRLASSSNGQQRGRGGAPLALPAPAAAAAGAALPSHRAASHSYAPPVGHTQGHTFHPNPSHSYDRHPSTAAGYDGMGAYGQGVTRPGVNGYGQASAASHAQVPRLPTPGYQSAAQQQPGHGGSYLGSSHTGARRHH